MEKEFEQIDDTIETPLEINIEEFLAEEPPVIEVETEAVVDNPAPEPVIESEVVAPVAEVVTPVAEVVAIQPEEKPVPFTTTQPAKKSNRRILTGKVKSNKPDKTVIVSIVRQVKHPLYKKYYKRTKSLMAHDENNMCRVGDVVKVRECRPLSARKRWELVEIVERAK